MKRGTSLQNHIPENVDTMSGIQQYIVELIEDVKASVDADKNNLRVYAMIGCTAEGAERRLENKVQWSHSGFSKDTPDKRSLYGHIRITEPEDQLPTVVTVIMQTEKECPTGVTVMVIAVPDENNIVTFSIPSK